jgi:hypothetical protein
VSISDEAVEAAARAIRDDDWPDHEDQIHHPIKDYMSNARAALKAAAPLIAAEAWDEGEWAGHRHGHYQLTNPYRRDAR